MTSRLATLLLTNRLTRLDTPPLKAREFWAVEQRCRAAGTDLGDLVGADETALAAISVEGVDPSRLATLLAATRALAFEIERLEDGSITLLSALDEAYPADLRDRLGHGCPPHLFVAGPVAWLRGRSLAIVGADDAGPDAHDLARAAVAAAVVADRRVVSDGSSPIGKTVVDEVLACHGSIIAVPDEGINRAARVPEVRRLVQSGQICLASPYPPDAAASAASSRARDTLVHALGELSLVSMVHDGTGPTWAASLVAVERDSSSVISWLGEGSAAGNAALVEMGAHPIHSIAQLHALLDIVPT